MKEIEYAMADKCNGDYPEIEPEPDDGSYHESGHEAGFDNESVNGTSHHGKQYVE